MLQKYLNRLADWIAAAAGRRRGWEVYEMLIDAGDVTEICCYKIDTEGDVLQSFVLQFCDVEDNVIR